MKQVEVSAESIPFSLVDAGYDYKIGFHNLSICLYLHRFIKKDGGKWPLDVLATHEMDGCQFHPDSSGKDEARSV
jgi:hypothetical protein